MITDHIADVERDERVLAEAEVAAHLDAVGHVEVLDQVVEALPSWPDPPIASTTSAESLKSSVLEADAKCGGQGTRLGIAKGQMWINVTKRNLWASHLKLPTEHSHSVNIVSFYRIPCVFKIIRGEFDKRPIDFLSCIFSKCSQLFGILTK